MATTWQLLCLGVLLGVLEVVVPATSEVVMPPVFSNPVEEKTEEKGKDAIFDIDCEASGIPELSYEWYFNEKPVTEDNPPEGRVTYGEKNGTLSVKMMSKLQAGSYRCYAKNKATNAGDYAVAVSPEIILSYSFVGTWPEEDRSPVYATVGQYVSIVCDDQGVESSGRVEGKWYKRTSTNEEVTSDLTRFIDKDGTLHFACVKVSDGQVPYSCALSDVDKIVFGNNVILTVTGPDSGSSPPILRYPSLEESQEGVTVLTGQDAVLECFFSGCPSPEVEWTDPAGSIIEGGDRREVEDNGRRLVIRNTVDADKGTYQCRVAGNPDYKGNPTKLKVISAPIPEEKLQSQTVVQGRNAVFNCYTKSLDDSAPYPPVWYKNGVLFPKDYDSQKYELSDQNRMLTVKDVQKPNDIACYQYSVSNSVGTLFASACLNVLEPISIEKQPPSKQTVTEGDRINLTVKAIADPLYSLGYEWTFKDQTYDNEPPPHVTFDKNTKEAYIDTTGMTDKQLKNITGDYVCKVYNPAEFVIVTTTVEVPAPVGPASAGFPFWIIGLILALLILLLIIIIICCVICRRKMQEGDYPVDRKETAAGLDPEKEMKESEFPHLSRAPDEYPDKKPGYLDMDGHSLRDDESFASTEYAEEPTAFNEDGSFIGVYKSKEKPSTQPRDNPGYNSGNESAV